MSPIPPNMTEKIEKIIDSLPAQKRRLLSDALAFAQKCHRNQKRKSGKPYISHPIAVAEKLWEKYQDPELTAAALMHDVLEDCESAQSSEIYEKFGKEVGFLVEAVSKNVPRFKNYPRKKFQDQLEKLLWAGLEDVRALILKLADREHNLRTVRLLPANKQIRMGFETQAVFSPLIALLGFHDNFSLPQAGIELGKFVKNEKLKTPKDLKERLLRQSFSNLDADLFGLYYQGVDSVVWKIEDYPTYVRITDNEELCRKLTFARVVGGTETFFAQFRFKEPAIIENVSLSPAYYRN